MQLSSKRNPPNTIRQSTTQAAALLAVLGAAVAAPADLLNSDFVFNMSAYQETLMDPESLSLGHACGDPIVEMVRHATPYLVLTNTSEVAFTGMELSIGDHDDHFGDVLGVGVDSDLAFEDIAFSFASDGMGSSAPNEAAQDYLRIQFLEALQPGESVVLRIALGDDADKELPNFLETMLGLGPEIGTPEISTLAISTTDPNCELPHTPFTPLDMDPPLIGLERAAVGEFASTVGVSLEIMEEPIPEASTAALAALALANLGAIRRRI